jgi:hypothetical protein
MPSGNFDQNLTFGPDAEAGNVGLRKKQGRKQYKQAAIQRIH